MITQSGESDHVADVVAESPRQGIFGEFLVHQHLKSETDSENHLH